jgi:Glycosyltransferase family 87
VLQAGEVVMQVFPNRPLAILLLAALAVNLIVRGIVPAMSNVDSDFPSYFTAAKIVADGGCVERLYDIPWFQEQMRRYQIGKPSEGKFSPQPPPMALMLVPLTPLGPLNALRVMTGVSALCLIGSIILLARILAWSTVDAAILVMLSGSAIASALRLGQPYILVSASCILGYYAYVRRRPWLAGACFGLFTPLKYFPVVILVYLAFRKRWQLVVGGTLAIVTVTLASIAVLGWKIHAQFLTSVLGNHLVARLSMQDPFTANFQSFDTLFRRLFVFDATANPRPLVAAPLLQGAGVLVTKTAIFLVAITTLVRLARSRGAAATAPSIGLLGIVTLLLAPATATYHMVLLWLPVALLVDFFLHQRAFAYAYFVLGSYALTGFYPYRFNVPFEGRGGLTVLAYPRLFLLLAMFTACVHGLWNRAESTQGMRTGALPAHLNRSP